MNGGQGATMPGWVFVLMLVAALASVWVVRHWEELFADDDEDPEE